MKRLLLSTIGIVYAMTACNHPLHAEPASTSGNTLESSPTLAKATIIPNQTFSYSAPTPTDIRLTLTKTQTPSATRSVQITSTTLVQTSSGDIFTPANNAPGMIYIWDPHSYGSLDPQISMQTYPWPVQPHRNGMPDPDQAIFATFSSYSQEIAYITEDEHLQVWIGSLGLEVGELIWEDTENWLEYSSSYDEIRMRWGPGDESLLISHNNERVVITLRDRVAVQVTGWCSGIGISPHSARLAAWCPIESNDGLAYSVLEQDGTQWYTSDLPEQQLGTAQDWSFSPDGEQVLFANENGQLLLAGEDGNVHTLPFLYAEPPFWYTINELQWSLDGSRLLIFAYLIEVECNFINCGQLRWYLTNATDGEVIWIPPDEINGGYDAELSRDGKWIVTFNVTLPYRYGYVTSIETNESTQIYTQIASAVTWGER